MVRGGGEMGEYVPRLFDRGIVYPCAAWLTYFLHTLLLSYSFPTSSSLSLSYSHCSVMRACMRDVRECCAQVICIL